MKLTTHKHCQSIGFGSDLTRIITELRKSCDEILILYDGPQPTFEDSENIRTFSGQISLYEYIESLEGSGKLGSAIGVIGWGTHKEFGNINFFTESVNGVMPVLPETGEFENIPGLVTRMETRIAVRTVASAAGTLNQDPLDAALAFGVDCDMENTRNGYTSLMTILSKLTNFHFRVYGPLLPVIHTSSIYPAPNVVISLSKYPRSSLLLWYVCRFFFGIYGPEIKAFDELIC